MNTLDQLERKQMLEREQAVVNRLKADLVGSPQRLHDLKEAAFSSLKDAESRMYKYACECDIGIDREKAFEIYENIRTAARVG